jgi:hypothetical protein
MPVRLALILPPRANSIRDERPAKRETIAAGYMIRLCMELPIGEGTLWA